MLPHSRRRRATPPAVNAEAAARAPADVALRTRAATRTAGRINGRGLDPRPRPLGRKQSRASRRRGPVQFSDAPVVPAGPCRSTDRVPGARGAQLRTQRPRCRGLPRPPPAAAPVDLQAPLPLDPAVRRVALDNGLTVYVRRNGRPANRVLLRLAVNAGSLDESDDQQGLAHFLEHMAFNGSAHFKPGEFISYFESVGARLGPHVNAQTGFEETIYMLDLPADRPDVIARGLTALADVAGGLTLDPEQVDKERGVVIEEWRGSLGAGTRVRDKQLPVIFRGSRFAERLPIGKPEIIRTAPASRLRAFYDAFYRPDRMAVVAVGDTDPDALEQGIRTTFAGLSGARRHASAAQRCHAARARHARERRGRPGGPAVDGLDPQEAAARAAGPRRRLPARPRGSPRAADDGRTLRGPRAAPGRADPRRWRGRRRSEPENVGVHLERVGCGRPPAGRTHHAGRSRPTACGSTASGRRSSSAHASSLRRTTRRRTPSETRPTATRFAREYVSHYLEGEPSPGIAVEYQLASEVLPGMTAADVAASAARLMEPESRVVLAVAPQKADADVPTEAEPCGRHSAKADTPSRSPPGATRPRTARSWNRCPTPAAIVSRRERAGSRRHRRPVRQRRRGVPQAHRLQERRGGVHDVPRGAASRSRRRRSSRTPRWRPRTSVCRAPAA